MTLTFSSHYSFILAPLLYYFLINSGFPISLLPSISTHLFLPPSLSHLSAFFSFTDSPTLEYYCADAFGKHCCDIIFLLNRNKEIIIWHPDVTLEANPIDFRRLEHLFEPTAFHCLATCALSFLRLLWWWLSNADMLIKEMIKSICHSHTAASRISSTALPFIWQYEINVRDRHGTYPCTVKMADMNSSFYLSTRGSGCTQPNTLEEREMMPLAHNHSFHPTVTYCLSWSTSLI